MRSNPNSAPFPRNSFLKEITNSSAEQRLHPLHRKALETAFRTRYPDDWPHLLGAADVFLDNYGALIAEQFGAWEELESMWENIREDLDAFQETAAEQVLGAEPWLGRYLLGDARGAGSGEPRPVLRMMCENAELDTSPLGNQVLQYIPDYTSLVVDDEPWSTVWRSLVDPDWSPERRPTSFSAPWSLGVRLPNSWAPVIPPIRLLPPWEATPDLPLRVGMTDSDWRGYYLAVRDQGEHGTCVAHAVATALEIAVARAGLAPRFSGKFSASWLHYASAGPQDLWDTGRSLGNTMDRLFDHFPCRESLFPYPAPDAGQSWRSEDRLRDGAKLKEILGDPEITRLKPDAIASIKTRLAAGWVVVVSASVPRSWESGALQAIGLPSVLTPGEDRADSGHAWLLIGYDHVDGNAQWKYQGRFWCVNSWGRGFPSRPIAGPGLCSLPFSYFLTEGIEAFAIRFPQK